ncbi:hypothetical protein JNJ66_00525 [Candidatus Saccharibacteria bacterium]|nr:hypothetical protein [Candidatus Saccharibacteria bacterium]
MVKEEKSRPDSASTAAEDDGPFPWKEWFLLRLIVFGAIAILFFVALNISGFFADKAATNLRTTRDAESRISSEDLKKVSAGIDKAYQTLPAELPLTYRDAQDVCTEDIEGTERIVCFKKSAYAKLRVKAGEPQGLHLSDTIAAHFTTAKWQQEKYEVVKQDGATVARSDSDGSDIKDVRLFFRSATIEGKQYCAGIVYTAQNEVQWIGTIKECVQSQP